MGCEQLSRKQSACEQVPSHPIQGITQGNKKVQSKVTTKVSDRVTTKVVAKVILEVSNKVVPKGKAINISENNKGNPDSQVKRTRVNLRAYSVMRW